MKLKLFFYLVLSTSQTNNYNLRDPELFKDEICSYNGNPGVGDKQISGFNDIICSCQQEFANDPDLDKTINGVNVQCSYERKRRFITLFLSIFLPFGFDYLYLGHYGIFLLIISFCFITLFGNCYRFAKTQHNESYIRNKWNCIFLFFAFLVVCMWVINIILIWVGIVKDSNNIETVDDLYYLININNNS
jgi:hypothetical protein